MPGPSTISAARRWGTVGVAALVVLLLDQLTKWWAVARLCDYPYCPQYTDREIDVVWTLRFNYAENTGMAFSKGSGAGRWIALIVIVVVVALVVLARNVRSVGGLVLIGVVIGGAFGNLFDRVFRATEGFMTGGVVDWIDVQWWPIFNIADAAVVVGGILVAIFLMREPLEPEPAPNAPAGGSPAQDTGSSSPAADVAPGSPDPEVGGS